MAVEFRIHPAIGVARVGNSPTESFLGPEDEGDPPPPPGGFRDAKGLLKPQAARFSVWASKQGAGTTTWHELTADLATITWHVAVKNDKPAAPGLELTFRNVYLQAAPGGTTKGPAAGASVVGAQATVGLASGAKTANLTGSCTFLAPDQDANDVMAALTKTYSNQIGQKLRWARILSALHLILLCALSTSCGLFGPHARETPPGQIRVSWTHQGGPYPCSLKGVVRVNIDGRRGSSSFHTFASCSEPSVNRPMLEIGDWSVCVTAFNANDVVVAAGSAITTTVDEGEVNLAVELIDGPSCK